MNLITVFDYFRCGCLTSGWPRMSHFFIFTSCSYIHPGPDDCWSRSNSFLDKLRFSIKQRTSITNIVNTMLYTTHSPSHAAVGRTLSNLRAGDPLGLTYHCPGMWQTAYVFHRHHQVPWWFQDSDSFIVWDAEEAAAVDLQNLVPNLWRREGTHRHGGGGWARWQG